MHEDLIKTLININKDQPVLNKLEIAPQTLETWFLESFLYFFKFLYFKFNKTIDYQLQVLISILIKCMEHLND